MYFFVKGKNPNISKSSIKVNLLLRIFKRSWKLKELSILTTSINSNFCAQIFKEDSQSQTLLFFYNINYNQSIVTEFSNRAPQLKEPFSCYLPIACCFLKFFFPQLTKQIIFHENYFSILGQSRHDFAPSRYYENLIAINPIGLRLLLYEAMDPSDCHVNKR